MGGMLRARVGLVCSVGLLALLALCAKQGGLGLGYSDVFTKAATEDLAETLPPATTSAPSRPIAYWAVTYSPLNFSAITAGPSEKPTAFPSDEPTKEPTPMPTPSPTPSPTQKPTEKPSPPPTEKPAPPPTGKPSEKPTGQPSVKPTEFPTIECKEEDCGAAKKEAQNLHLKADQGMAGMNTEVDKFYDQVTALEKNAAKDLINILMLKDGPATDPGVQMISLARSANASLVETLELAREDLLLERGQLDATIEQLELQRAQLIQKRANFSAMVQDKVRAGEQASAKMGRQIKDIIERVTAANQQS